MTGHEPLTSIIVSLGHAAGIGSGTKVVTTSPPKSTPETRFPGPLRTARKHPAGAATALLSLLASATFFPAAAAGPALVAVAASHVADVTQLLATLQDPNAAAQTRSGAAQELVRIADKLEAAYAVA